MLKQWTLGFLVVIPLVALGCSDDDTDNMNNNIAGSGGSSGKGGSAGSNAQAGSGGQTTASGGSTSSGGTATAGTGGAMTTGMPRGKASMPTPGAQIDRMGRPAINTALNETFNADAAMKDAQKDKYNAAGAANFKDFTAAFKTSLGILDALDASCGNQLLYKDGEDPYATLASVLIDDQLYVNTASGECGVYLGVEAEGVKAVPEGGGKCGGRTPNDDVIERSYSVLAAGALTGVDDTIAKDDATHSLTEFPFLAAPK